jgi:predicted HicB family RNase H-like nuclease
MKNSKPKRRGRPPLPGVACRTVVFNLRVTTETMRRFREAARGVGKSVGAWARDCLLAKVAE